MAVAAGVIAMSGRRAQQVARREPLVLKGRAPARSYYLLGRAEQGECFKDSVMRIQASR